MKRLLFYNQLPDFTIESQKVKGWGLEVQEVASISGALRDRLFRRKANGGTNAVDVFLVRVTASGYDIVEFLDYVGRYRPELPMIILSDSAEQTNLLHGLLKGITCEISEARHMEEVLKKFCS